MKFILKAILMLIPLTLVAAYFIINRCSNCKKKKKFKQATESFKNAFRDLGEIIKQR